MDNVPTLSVRWGERRKGEMSSNCLPPRLTVRPIPWLRHTIHHNMMSIQDMVQNPWITPQLLHKGSVLLLRYITGSHSLIERTLDGIDNNRTQLGV